MILNSRKFHIQLCVLLFLGYAHPLCMHAQITGSGTANTVPVFTGTSAIGDSVITQPSTSKVVIGSTTTKASLQITGPSPWVDVKAFGATGNGTTDDSTAIQAAITAAGSGTVFFPCGKYYITTGLTENSVGFTLLGQAGTSFLSAGGGCATIETDQAIVILKLGTGVNSSLGGRIEHLGFRDTSTAGAGYNSSRCPAYDLPCGGNATGGIYIDGPSFVTLTDLELDGFSGASEYGIKMDGGTFYINHDYLNHIVMNECQYCVIIAGKSDGPEMNDMLLYPGSPVTGVSGSIGIDCQSGCSGVHLEGGKCTVAGSTNTCLKIAGLNNDFNWLLESYTANEGATCCQNEGVEVVSGATQNRITVNGARFTDVVLLDSGSSISSVNVNGNNNTNLFTNHSTSGNNLLINSQTGTISQSQ